MALTSKYFLAGRGRCFWGRYLASYNTNEHPCIKKIRLLAVEYDFIWLYAVLWQKVYCWTVIIIIGILISGTILHIVPSVYSK